MRIVGPAASLPVLILAFTFAATDGANAESKSPRKKVAALTPLVQHWNHNGSVVSLVSDGKKQKFVYDAPRVGLLDVGVKPGTVLFEGQREGHNITGTAYQFYRTCKAHSYDVTGATSDDRKTITLKGKVPVLDLNCNSTGTRDDVLIFTAVQSAPAEPAKETPVAINASSPPEVTRTATAPAAEGNKAKSGEAPAASGTAATATQPQSTQNTKQAPVEPAKDKQAAIEPPKEKQAVLIPSPEKQNVPAIEPAKDTKVSAPTAAVPANNAASGNAPSETEILKEVKQSVPASTPKQAPANTAVAAPEHHQWPNVLMSLPRSLHTSVSTPRSRAMAGTRKREGCGLYTGSAERGPREPTLRLDGLPKRLPSIGFVK